MTKREFKRRFWYPVSVEIEIRLRRFRRRVGRVYKRSWPVMFASYIMLVISLASIIMYHDYDSMCARLRLQAQIDWMLDEPFSDRYQHWRTDGNPGKDPSK